MSKQGLSEMPLDLVPADVNWLILSDNRLKKIPREVGCLKGLSRLALNDNQIEEIEPSIGACGQITWIDLTRNRLRSLPDEMGQLTRISGLGLSENEFETIPECVYRLRNLRKFGFFSNRVSVISPNIRFLRALVKVDLSNNRLVEIPDEFCSLVNISWLNLSNNRLKRLPANIGKLIKLEELGLGVNELTEIPDISTLDKLRILPVFRNKIKHVHPSISKLKNIEKLDLSDNLVEEFPVDIIYNPSMRYLNLRNNKICVISPYDFTGGVSSIGMVDISDNRLRSIPYKFFKAFTEATTVRLGGNCYDKRAPVLPDHQSLMKICFSKILSRKEKVEPWVSNMFRKFNTCDYCKASFVVDPCFSYVVSYLDIDSQFVIEKMCCSVRCLRLSEEH